MTAKSHKLLIDPLGKRAWQDGVECVWKEHGVWEWDDKANAAIPIRCDYFSRNFETGREVDWYTDCYFPFLRRFSKRIDEAFGRDVMSFVAPIPNEVRQL